MHMQRFLTRGLCVRAFCIFFGRCNEIATKDYLINGEIKCDEVRVTRDGQQLGIMPLASAMQLAESEGLDLVLIAPQATPPVCRIVDYGKLRFEQQKREKEQRKNQKIVELKEIRLSLNIGEHDFNTKVKHAVEFIGDGDKVKASIRFRGREMSRASMGYAVMNQFAETLAECATIEKPAKIEGRSMTMIIAPKPVK